MKSIVVYSSKHGSTKMYAEWIAEALGCEAVNLKDVDFANLSGYDTVIYGGSIYAGGIFGFRDFLSKYNDNQGKQKLVLFMVGMTTPKAFNVYEKIVSNETPAEWKGKFKAFAFHGNLLFSKLTDSEAHKLSIPKMMAEKKPPEQRTMADQQFIDDYGKDTVYADKNSIQPLVDFVNKKV